MDRLPHEQRECVHENLERAHFHGMELCRHLANTPLRDIGTPNEFEKDLLPHELFSDMKRTEEAAPRRWTEFCHATREGLLEDLTSERRCVAQSARRARTGFRSTWSRSRRRCGLSHAVTRERESPAKNNQRGAVKPIA